MTELNDWIRGVSNQSIGQCWIANCDPDEKQLIDMALRTYCPSACGGCQSCRIWATGEHPDFHFLRSIDGHSIKVEDIRQVGSRTLKRPVSSHHIVIISSAHALTEASYNCLLKTLEESQHAWFILCTPYVHMLPQTIKSRCQTLRLDSPSDDSYDLWHGCLDTNMFVLQKTWAERKMTVDVVVTCLLKWVGEHASHSPKKSIWMDAFDDVVLWNAQYKSRSNIADGLMYEKLACLTSRLYQFSQKT